MDIEPQNANGKAKELSEASKMVGVFEAGGNEVGSLWKVMRAYEVFTQAMTEWGERNKGVRD